MTVFLLKMCKLHQWFSKCWPQGGRKRYLPVNQNQERKIIWTISSQVECLCFLPRNWWLMFFSFLDLLSVLILWTHLSLPMRSLPRHPYWKLGGPLPPPVSFCQSNGQKMVTVHVNVLVQKRKDCAFSVSASQGLTWAQHIVGAQ